MSRKRRTGKASSPQRTTDSYQNLTARYGLRTENQSADYSYQPNWTSRNRQLIENAYRSSWLVGAAVDTIADDMTRKGINITSKMAPDAKMRIEGRWEELSLWDSLNDTIKWSRLYGGAIGFIMIDGQAPETPLRVETIGKDAFKGLLVLDRWMVNPTISDRVTEMGPDLGMPKYYQVVTTGSGIPSMKIHHSRVIRLDGVGLPYQQKRTENEWGMSVIERLFDRLLAFDSTSTGAAQLIFKAHLRTYKINKFRELVAMGGKAFDGLMKSMDMIRQFQSTEGLTLMDATDTFETHSYAFGGLSDVMAQFAQQIAGAIGIPLVRLFGQSPAGFSTGDADLANYYDNIGTQQERRLRRPLRRLFEVIHYSEFSSPLPDGFSFDFNPLWQMTEPDRATVAEQTVNTINAAMDSGLLTLQGGMTELRDKAGITGIGSSISDEDIENAKDIDPPSFGENANLNPLEVATRGGPVPNSTTQDSASGRGHRKWYLRWLK
ncbi:TPA: DUF1073 domain-containing protein [Yersinia enterocolitica]|nr:DUF1073 domain-containing protein [Yersinia enterocolitica]EKN4012743.1 DUF1073 domain-containing protein [Yersinia enterocolitica]ELI8046930.1 DUF1073 domain-containing protein [Yersinia enterocolitica]ELI8444720.1 DUF1073 domain-containing protein [Yersinia enterocolitica]HDM8322724.1 DUF1073 domain-containing protein [Yersinia enterocolitica]